MKGRYFVRSGSRKILVTGGAGFLGSHLCDKLIEMGHCVICLDNLSTGNLSNIGHLENSKNFEFIEHNIEDPITLEVEQIYNLACPASPPKYQIDPISTFKTSAFGALNMLENAKAFGARILQASTSEVYGDPLISPQAEDYRGNVNPIGVRACYDEGKRAAETLFSDYSRKHMVDVRIARIFNTYGPNMDINDGRVVTNFVSQALSNQPLTVYGDGEQTRSFCYVDDLICGLITLMNTSVGISDPVNLGNPNEFTVNQLAALVIQKTASKSEIHYLELPQDDPMQRCPDISKANEVLGWWPNISLANGLDKTIEYFKAQTECQ